MQILIRCCVGNAAAGLGLHFLYMPEAPFFCMTQAIGLLAILSSYIKKLTYTVKVSRYYMYEVNRLAFISSISSQIALFEIQIVPFQIAIR